MKSTRTVLLEIALVFALLYTGDYLSVRYRIPRSRSSLGSVEVQPYYAVPLKDGKTEFIFLKPEQQVCVKSLFPHLGHVPCWYLQRKRDKRIDL